MGSATGSRIPSPSARKNRIRTGTDESYLTRLSVVHADELRLTIVTELNMREMSPKQFYEEFGGPSYDSVRRHFRKLAEHGWLRKVRTERASGRGRPQDVYRTTELAVIDDETLAELPASIRDAFTAQTFRQMGERFGSALAGKTLDARSDRVLSWTNRILDEAGWEAATEELNGCFHTLRDEQIDAKVRLEKSGAPSILTVVALSGFETPDGASAPELPPSTSLVRKRSTEESWNLRLAKVFADPANLRVIDELNRSVMSATELATKFGDTSVYAFDRKCKALTDLGWLVKVEEKTGGIRRGATEHFYRAAVPGISEAEVWAGVPEAARAGVGWAVFRRFTETALDAIRRGSFNHRLERHLTWSNLLLDEVGWRQVVATLERSLRSLDEIEKDARKRLAASRRPGIHAAFLLTCFEAPQAASA